MFPAHVPLGVNSDDRTRCEVRLSATRGLFIAELDKTQPSCCCFPPVTVKPHTHSVLTRDNTQGCTCCSHRWHNSSQTGAHCTEQSTQASKVPVNGIRRDINLSKWLRKENKTKQHFKKCKDKTTFSNIWTVCVHGG